MGAGIALEIKHNFPKAYKADLKTNSSDKSKLGNDSYRISKKQSNKNINYS